MAFDSPEPADAEDLEIHGIVRDTLDPAASSSMDSCAAEKSGFAVHEAGSAPQADLTFDE